MLGYLSKFVLQMLPTIAATVIGAYIVTTWVNPKPPSDATKIAARGLEPRPAKATYPVGQPAPEAATEETEKTASAAETIRVIPIVKQAPLAAESAVSAPTPAAEPTAVIDERKDANTLARAAIQRQRGSIETRIADEPAKPVASRAPQARAAPEPLPAATVAPPLPPPVTVAAPRYTLADNDSAASDRPTPPADVPPARNPLSLQASHRVAADNPSPADEFLNATRAFFRALTPQ